MKNKKQTKMLIKLNALYLAFLALYMYIHFCRVSYLQTCVQAMCVILWIESDDDGAKKCGEDVICRKAGYKLCVPYSPANMLLHLYLSNYWL